MTSPRVPESLLRHVGTCDPCRIRLENKNKGEEIAAETLELAREIEAALPADETLLRKKASALIYMLDNEARFRTFQKYRSLASKPRCNTPLFAREEF